MSDPKQPILSDSVEPRATSADQAKRYTGCSWRSSALPWKERQTNSPRSTLYRIVVNLVIRYRVRDNTDMS